MMKGQKIMGKFDGMLLCTDLDDTLLTDNKQVSEKNRKAIDYFKSEGGLFTFSTGRVPMGARLILEYVVPNAPIVCFNGGGIYDFSENKILWSRKLDSDAISAVEYVDRRLDFVGIEICTEEKIYFSKINAKVREHQILEKLPDNDLDYHDIPEVWQKVLFMTEEHELNTVRRTISESPFADKYTFVQSSPWYYELLPKNSTKGDGLIQLGELCGIDRSRIIAVGDNENDLEMVKMAGVGIAVENAIPIVKNSADYVTADNNSDAIAKVIYDLENGTIKTA
ncbi:Cof-type HAD-IIB family hydrolase [Lachnospiraceae bacterium MD329]|nr:Cof-type HAD-IIB family hydrolase [Lachnospiraceae bacterium MD329]